MLFIGDKGGGYLICYSLEKERVLNKQKKPVLNLRRRRKYTKNTYQIEEIEKAVDSPVSVKAEAASSTANPTNSNHQ